MEVTVRLAGGERIVKVEGTTAKELFEEMATAYEVFNESECGQCGSRNIRPIHRIVDKFHYYEYECQECFARLKMGQLSDVEGALFPVRKLLPNGKPDFKGGDYGNHRGWSRYRGEAKDDQPPSPPRETRPPKQEAEKPLTQADRVKRVLDALKGAGAESDLDLEVMLQFITGNEVTLDGLKTSEESLELAENKLSEAWKKHGTNLKNTAHAWDRAERALSRSQAGGQLEKNGSVYQLLRTTLKDLGCQSQADANLLIQFAMDDQSVTVESCKHNVSKATKANRLLNQHKDAYGEGLFQAARDWNSKHAF